MKKSQGMQGFTLIELMAAVLILSIGILGMMKLQMYAVQGNAFGGRMSAAVALAQDQMENLINRSLEPWPEGSIAGSQIDPSLLGRQYQGYTVNWTIMSDSPIPNVAIMNVQVHWPGGQNPISMTRYKRR
jgi:type IV pilus assembly protein PilV